VSLTELFRPTKLSCNLKSYTLNSMLKNIGMAIATATFAVFIAPTVVPPTIFAGIFLLALMGCLAFVASYGLLAHCVQRSGGIEFIIAFLSAFAISMVLGYVYLQIPTEVLFSLEVMKTEVLVATAVGGFFGSILK